MKSIVVKISLLFSDRYPRSYRRSSQGPFCEGGTECCCRGATCACSCGCRATGGNWPQQRRYPGTSRNRSPCRRIQHRRARRWWHLGRQSHPGRRRWVLCRRRTCYPWSDPCCTVFGKSHGQLWGRWPFVRSLRSPISPVSIERCFNYNLDLF